MLTVLVYNESDADSAQIKPTLSLFIFFITFNNNENIYRY